MSILMNDAKNANISILQRTNELFGITQKRVSTGKRIFSSADDATRFKMSESLLGRSRQLDGINNNISLGLATLEATDQTLKNMQGLIESALTLARKAQSEGGVGMRSTTATANINESTTVVGAVVGSRFSISTDDGRVFNYTFPSTTVAWGDIANALNSANIGVIAEFIPSTVAGQSNLRFRSITNQDFTFDATSDENVMDDLAGLSTPTGQAFIPANLFANGIAAPAAGETGLTVAYGGHLTGTAGVTGATAIAAGSTLTFVDGNGVYRSLTYPAGTTVAGFMNDVLVMGAGIKAELVNQTGGAGGPLNLRMRNMRGGNMQVVSASGAFAAAGTLGFNGVTVGYAPPLSTNNALRLSYGAQYDAIIDNLDRLVANNPVPAGRNLLQGRNMNIFLDEFSGTPLQISGTPVTAAGTLTMAQAGASWTSDQNIATSVDQINQGLIVVRGLQAQFATFVTYIRSQYEQNRDYKTETKTQGDELVASDVTEESAALLALQTRQEFAVQSLTIGNQNDRSLLRLFG